MDRPPVLRGGNLAAHGHVLEDACRTVDGALGRKIRFSVLGRPMSAHKDADCRKRVPSGASMAESPEGRTRRPWLVPGSRMPGVIGSVCALIGLLNLATGIIPGLRHGRMHTLAEYLPGTVSSIAAAASVIVGLLLLMLAHGLKRRKRRAWTAAALLLPAGVLAELLHHRLSLVATALSVGLCVLLLTHRSEFAALSDPRTRWRAVVNFVGLSIVSFLLGLVIVSVHPKSEVGSPSFVDRCRTVLYGLFGLGGPVHYLSDRTADLVGYTLGGLGFLILVTTAYLVLKPGTPGGGARGAGRGAAARPAGPARAARLARALRAAPRQERGLLGHRQGGDLLPGRLRRDAGQRRPDRRRRGVAGRHRAVHGGGQGARLDPRGGRVQRDRRRGVDPGDRTGRAGAGRRGDRRRPRTSR